jgi:hypothetical protein
LHNFIKIKIKIKIRNIKLKNLIFITKMSIVNKTITVNNTKQLIDLNGEKINFDLTFQITSKNKSPFYTVVVSQKTLDNTIDLDYKFVSDGYISGNIISNKGFYQNYYIVLKADTPTECQITIDIKDVPQVEEIQEPLNQIMYEEEDPPKSDYLIKIISVVCIIIVGMFLYYYYTNIKNNKTESNNQSNITNIQNEIQATIPNISENIEMNSINNNLLSRINDLNTW